MMISVASGKGGTGKTILSFSPVLVLVLQEGPALKESDKFFLGLHRHQWTNIHLYMSLAFSVSLVFHLNLEWIWIKGKSRMLFMGAWRHVLGLIVTCALLLPLVFWVFMPKNEARYYEFSFGRGQGRGAFALTEGNRRLPASVEDPEVHEAYPAEKTDREGIPAVREDPAAPPLRFQHDRVPERCRRADGKKMSFRL